MRGSERVVSEEQRNADSAQPCWSSGREEGLQTHSRPQGSSGTLLHALFWEGSALLLQALCGAGELGTDSLGITYMHDVA